MSAEHSKKASMCTVYEIRWETMAQFQRQKRDFPLTQDISNWLFDLIHYNTDDMTMVEKDWHIFHVTPGHLFVFLTLCAKDLQKRIQYPFKAPGGGWTSRPLPSATWTEHRYSDYWNFIVKLNEMRGKPSFSKTRVKIE